MRKTLLIAAAALAAGVISSQAQVYSQNIVGYVNMPIPTGFNNLAVPLDASDASGINNAITNTINVFSGMLDGSSLYIWNGHGYNIFTIDSGQSTGIGNALDTAAVAPPVLPPGTAFYINNSTGATTNTFVGTVHVDGAATGAQTVGVTTNSLPVGEFFYSSKLPVGGGAASVLGLPALSGSLDGSILYVPVITGGAIHGYTAFTIDSGQTPSGFGNALDTAEVPEPVIPVGTGFLLNNSTGATSWVQTL